MVKHETHAHVETGRRGAFERADYLIGRFRVAYQFGGGWACGCVEFAKSDTCRHTREAAGRYIAQVQIAKHIARGSPNALLIDTRATASQSSWLHPLLSGGLQTCPTENYAVL